MNRCRRWTLRPARCLTICLAIYLSIGPVMFHCMEAFAMEAPGNGGTGWVYNDKKHHWCYYEEDQTVHTGWLEFEGEWYWFNEDGWMTDSGYRNIDNARYFFFANGHMAWNQFVGLRYYDEKGQRQEEKDVRIIGSTSPTTEDRDLFSDDFYYVPRSWTAKFVEDGWQFMFYKSKKYFAAPDTDMGIYYVYHDVDTHYKKVKFNQAEEALQAFGEYVGYAAGCYKKNSQWMQKLWNEYPAVSGLLDIPDYYANDAQFYFGKLFEAYLREETYEDIRRSSETVCQVMEEILHMHDDEATRALAEARRKAEEEERARQQERMIAEQGYGPGVKQPEESDGSEESKKSENISGMESESTVTEDPADAGADTTDTGADTADTGADTTDTGADPADTTAVPPESTGYPKEWKEPVYSASSSHFS